MGGSKSDPERLDEFAMIARHFAPLSKGEAGALGLLDDGAVLDVPTDQQLIVTTDTLVDGVHFLPDTSAADIATKSLAANVSDLASMGAGAKWIFLNLQLPEKINDDWLAEFAESLKAALAQCSCVLAGGDTVRTPGPLAISITAMGMVDQGRALKRSGAKPGDDIWVSGTLGDAKLGLDLLQGKLNAIEAGHAEFLKRRHLRPIARTGLGQSLGHNALANACIDISDGLVADLGHICVASGVSAVLQMEDVPLSPAARTLGRAGELAALGGGDDYELLFAADAQARATIEALGQSLGLAISRIGEITDEATHSVKVRNSSGAEIAVPDGGWRHF